MLQYHRHEAKLLFKENLWAEIAVKIMNRKPLSIKDSQDKSKRAGRIFKYAGMFENAKENN